MYDVYNNYINQKSVYCTGLLDCCVQDLSYHCCIEITGRQQHIVESLSRITNSEIGMFHECYSFIIPKGSTSYKSQKMQCSRNQNINALLLNSYIQDV